MTTLPIEAAAENFASTVCPISKVLDAASVPECSGSIAKE